MYQKSICKPEERYFYRYFEQIGYQVSIVHYLERFAFFINMLYIYPNTSDLIDFIIVLDLKCFENNKKFIIRNSLSKYHS